MIEDSVLALFRVLLIGVSYKVYLGAVISAIILVVLAVSVTG